MLLKGENQLSRVVLRTPHSLHITHRHTIDYIVILKHNLVQEIMQNFKIFFICHFVVSGILGMVPQAAARLWMSEDSSGVLASSKWTFPRVVLYGVPRFTLGARRLPLDIQIRSISLGSRGVTE